MSESTVAIVGSGIAGATIAHMLTERGHDVTMFEIGPECPYPHVEQFTNEIVHLEPSSSLYVPHDLRSLVVTGDYVARDQLALEQVMVVGGMATRWGGWTPRYLERDFKVRSRSGYGVDWPIDYATLEPYYCRADALLGISGTDDDNPLAPPRSKPYPLPPFPLAPDDLVFRDRLASAGIHLHSVPQARVSKPYDGRQACVNFGVCQCCPIGARYSPNHHLQRSLATGKLMLHPNAAVRRLVADAHGRVTSLVYHPGNGARAEEHHAKIVIVAAGAIESARLLLLSKSGEHPDGLGNAAGHCGRHLMFNHIYTSVLELDEDVYPGRVGYRSAQSYQLVDTDGRHGAFYKLDFASGLGDAGARFPKGRGNADPSTETLIPDLKMRNGRDVLAALREMLRLRVVSVNAESTPSEGKRVELSARLDRFGSPFAAVRYESNDFDAATKIVVERLAARFGRAAGAKTTSPIEQFRSGHHHVGTCRMAAAEADGVTDAVGRVHGLTNLFVAGGSVFPSISAANPTLTIAALALRTGDYILEQLAHA